MTYMTRRLPSCLVRATRGCDNALIDDSHSIFPEDQPEHLASVIGEFPASAG
jgi:hypothetical protein